MPSCGQLSSIDAQNIILIREGVRGLCKKFPGSYWQALDQSGSYPTEFVKALTKSGYLAALIPEQFGGSGLGLREAGAILEEISKSGGHPGACHAQIYAMGTLLRHGSDAQKEAYLPPIASGQLRLQAFAVTEPDAGSDTTRIATTADRDGNTYRINGRKIWISRVEHSDLMILLARTEKRDDKHRTRGLSAFLIDLREAIGNGLTVTPIRTMINHHTTELVFENLAIPEDNLIGEAGEGFRYILDGMNAERILIAAECIGDARFFIGKAAKYAKDRSVFGRPIGQNQGVQFPIARAYAETEAAALMVEMASGLFDQNNACGSQANMAKLLAADASWKAADMCLQIFGGAGFAAEFDIERKFRETRLYQVAPLSTNLILSHLAVHDLGLPKSY